MQCTMEALYLLVQKIAPALANAVFGIQEKNQQDVVVTLGLALSIMLNISRFLFSHAALGHRRFGTSPKVARKLLK